MTPDSRIKLVSELVKVLLDAYQEGKLDAV